MVNEGASLAPVIPMVMLMVSEAVPSETVIVNASETDAPAPSAVVSASLLSSVYVQDAPENAMDP